MSHHVAFLADILAHPEDDAPRLIYADWLDETGDDADRARAEFIRLECQAAQLDEGDAREELQARADALLQRFRSAWFGDIADLVESYNTRRGFVGHVLVSARNFLEHAEDIFRLAPVQELYLFDTKSKFKALADCPHLAKLTYLGFDEGCVTAAGVEALAGSPHLANLRKLDLGEGTVGVKGATALARSPHLAGLVSLNLKWGSIGDKGLQALARARALGGLRELVLDDNEIGKGLGALAEGNLSGLVSLSLNSNEVGAEELQALSCGSALSRLEGLLLNWNPGVGDVGAEVVVGWGAAWRGLHLFQTGITPSGVRALAGSQSLAGLRELGLSNNILGPEGAQILALSPTLRTLDGLYLSSTEIGPTGAEVLADSPVLASVRTLDLSACRLGDAGVKALVRSPHLGHLRHLHLSDNGLGDDSAQALAEAPALEGLRTLVVRNARFSDRGRQGLRGAFGARCTF